MKREEIKKILAEYGITGVRAYGLANHLTKVNDGEIVCCATCTLMKNDRCASKEMCRDFNKHIHTPYQSRLPQPTSEGRIDYVFDMHSNMERKMSYEGFKAALKELGR